jgi:hypothetical protein
MFLFGANRNNYSLSILNIIQPGVINTRASSFIKKRDERQGLLAGSNGISI